MNPYGTLANSEEPAEPTDVEFFKFTGLVADAKVALQEGSFDVSQYPATVSLIAVSNKQGYFAAATTQGFTFGTTKSLRSTFLKADKGATVQLEDKISVAVPNPIRQIRFSADETQLLVATQGGIVLVYNVSDITGSKGSASATYTFALNQEIVDIRPNPEAIPNLVSVLFDNNQCKIINITNGSTECELPLNDISAICWSPKGKQIVCGRLDGSLEHYDAKGARKDAFAIPRAMSAGHNEEEVNRYVQDVLWIENHIFLVLYARPRINNDDEYINDGYLINRKPSAAATEPQYTRLAEITPIFTTEGRGNHFYMEIIRNLGQEIKHLVIIGNAATNEMSVVGQLADGQWATWMLPENGVAALPLSDEGSMDTYPLGLALDFTADEKLPPVDAGESDVGVDPMPIFYYINDEGVIGSYHCYNTEIARKGEPYNAMSSFSSGAAAPATTASVTQIPAATPASGFSAFASASTGSSSFGDLLSGKSTSPPAPTTSGGFGSFGSFGVPPASSAGGFSFSSLASTQNIPPSPSTGFGALASANKASIAPAAALSFGSTTNIGFGNTTAFGASTSSVDKPLSAFGTATKTEDQTAPISSTASAFGGMKMSQTRISDAEVPKSAFGLTDTKAATPAFGSTSTVGTSGFGSFGSTAAKAAPAITTVSFSTSDTRAAEPKASLFGSTSTIGSGGGFGSLAKPTVPGATAPAFGSSSTLGGGFGSLATKPTSATSTTSSFGLASSLGSGDKFASLSKTVPGATTSTFGSSSGFGALAKSTETTAPTTSSLFGSGSGFGALNIADKKIEESKTAASTTSAPSIVATNSADSAAKPTETKPASSPIPATFKSPTATPTPTSLMLAARSEIDKDKAPATSTTIVATTKEKQKPTADEGMAREYELLYITVCEAIANLISIHERIEIIVSYNTNSEPKTLASIKDTSSEWNLNDVTAYAKLTESIVANIQKDQASAAQIKEQLEALSLNSKKSMDKKEDIGYMLRKEIDAGVVDIMDNRELDAETKTALSKIESRSEASEHTLSDLEFKVQEYKKRNKIKNDHRSGELTLYSLHRTVRDIQRDIVARNNDMAQLEEQLALMKLNNSKRRAKASSAGFSVDDFTDSEDEDEPSYKSETTEYTARYLRRFNFLNDVCIKSSRRSPLQCPVD